MTIPNDYLERVYAGVLGKLIGVYLGRPFEQWTHQRIMRELGPIEYYVHERLNEPLVVTDDDVAGTFTFVRALEDYGITADLSAEDIGKAWLNYIVEEKSILWWGGNGNSTEHTAWLNLKNGIPAPHSGSMATNGSTVAEQIGAQIFVDGWALVSPCQPQLAAQLAQKAGSVSHDGESVYAAMLWAAMEAEAFRSADINHLIDTGLSVIPKDSLIAKLIAEIRDWRKTDDDWMVTRQRIEDQYGYAQYPGNCHVVPNHALMIMSVLYAPDDFQRAQMIVNTSGWDTDCNAGNVGCLMGIMLGLEGIDAGPDWRGPIADRLLISSADGGNSINDAVRMAYYLANLGLTLAGHAPLSAPEAGAQFHFSLPGSTQGFRSQDGQIRLSVTNIATEHGRALAARFQALGPGQVAAVTTPVFSPREVLQMKVYDLMATPLIYPGQDLEAAIAADVSNIGALSVTLRLRVYDEYDNLKTLDSAPVALQPGDSSVLRWTIPDLRGQPIAEIGVAFTASGKRADGCIVIDHVRWSGAPQLTLQRPEGEGIFWRMAWVNGVSFFSKRFPPSFRISQDRGDGIIIHGTRQWTDYTVESDVMLHLGTAGGLAARVQGLRRYYALRLVRKGTLQIIKVRDDVTTILAEAAFPVELEVTVSMKLTVLGPRILGEADGTAIEACDDGDQAFLDGGIGLVISDGAISTPSITIGAAETMIAEVDTAKETSDVLR